MCRNIKTLFNFEPPATENEIHASALQFVRKLSGFNKPSQANAEAFDRAVAEVSASARRLLASLHTQAPARDREIEAERAKERSRLRFGEGFERLRAAATSISKCGAVHMGIAPSGTSARLALPYSPGAGTSIPSAE